MADRGYIVPRLSWPRPATATMLTPAWAGEFKSFEDWVNFASHRLTGTCDPHTGGEVKAVCIDNIGRRCTMGAHFQRARDEGTFPVRYFFDCAPTNTPRDPVPVAAEIAAHVCGGAPQRCTGWLAKIYNAAYAAAEIALARRP